jgi:hypothetical protein
MISIKRILLVAVLAIVGITIVLLFTGSRNMTANLSRIIKNSSPKTPEEIYSILFNQPLENCVSIKNTKDQLLPVLDCCIWMEIQLCPAELNRIIQQKKYELTVYTSKDSLNLSNSFPDRPSWWNPALLQDTICKLRYSTDPKKVQTLFFGSDSSQVFLCDMAL